jgi:hypothetical protein
LLLLAPTYYSQTLRQKKEEKRKEITEYHSKDTSEWVKIAENSQWLRGNCAAGWCRCDEDYGEGQQDEHDTLACGRGGQFAGIGKRETGLWLRAHKCCGMPASWVIIVPYLHRPSRFIQLGHTTS